MNLLQNEPKEQQNYTNMGRPTNLDAKPLANGRIKPIAAMKFPIRRSLIIIVPTPSSPPPVEIHAKRKGFGTGGVPVNVE